MTSGKPGTSIHFYRRRERTEAYGGLRQDRRAYALGYYDGFMQQPRVPLPLREEHYEAGYRQGEADAEEEREHVATAGHSIFAFKNGLKNVRRTATRRLDDAGMPTERQGED